jgi:hypothetical protein
LSHTVESVAVNIVPSLVGIDLESEAFVWVCDLADLVLVVDEEAGVISTDSDADSSEDRKKRTLTSPSLQDRQDQEGCPFSYRRASC